MMQFEKTDLDVDSPFIIVIEDNEQWQNDIHERLEETANSQGASFAQFSEIQPAEYFCLHMSPPSVVILDLNFGSLSSFPDRKGIAWIEGHLHQLYARGHEVFVVSGFLNLRITKDLTGYGIPEDHIFRKPDMDWMEFRSRVDFALQMLPKTLRTNQQSANERMHTQDSDASAPRVDIAVTFEGDKEDRDTVFISPQKERSYNLSIEVSALDREAANKRIQFFVAGANATTDGQLLVLHVPPPGKEARLSALVLFPKTPEGDKHQLTVNAYYYNSFLGHFVFPLAFI